MTNKLILKHCSERSGDVSSCSDLDYILESRLDSGKEKLTVATRFEPESECERQETNH